LSENGNELPRSETPDETAKRTDAFYAARGVSEECPMCRNEYWWFLDPNPLETRVSFTGDQYYRTYTYVCTNCGFVRQHGRDVVDGLLKAHRGPQ
jgi:predicted RNA-binding Zn-ribbon protein involved in translation (DUF1610 family)